MYGNLGDHLQFSTLARRFSELGHDFYISKDCLFNGDETKEFVWGLNPYVSGESDQFPNCGDFSGNIYRNYDKGFIANWEYVHGLPPESKYPEVYYDPTNSVKRNSDERIFVDVTANSLKDDYDGHAIEKYLKDHYDPDSLLVGFTLNKTNQLARTDRYDFVVIKDIYHYCDLIYRSRKFVCLFSGSSVLASALQMYGSLKVECLVVDHPKTRSMLAQDLFFFNNIKYIWI